MDAGRSPGTSGDGPRWRLYIGIGAVILAAIFILQNAQKVRVDFLFSTTDMPLIFALLFAAILGFIIGLAWPRFRQPRERK